MNISETLEKELDPEDLQLLRHMGRLAAGLGLGLYLVGGTVRDVLLMSGGIDLDLLVGGDAGELARLAAAELDAECHTHGVFGTATIFLASGRRIDLAAARSETYSRPGALPDVSPAPAEKDLGRRDFSINAMAASILPDNFGDIIDPFGGMADLDARLLRVLHDGSFTDDPTRIFRGVRFAARFGFEFEALTLERLREAIANRAMDAVSGARIKKELEYGLADEHRRGFVSLSSLHGLGAGLARGFEFDTSLFCPSDAAAKSRADLAASGTLCSEPWLEGLAAAAVGNPDRATAALAARLDSTKHERKVIELAGDRKFYALLQELDRENVPPSDTAESLSGVPDEIIACLHAAGNDNVKKNIMTMVETARGMELEISGDDLIKLGYRPSPAFGPVLREVLRRKIDGRVKNREEELSLAEDLLEGGWGLE